VEQKANWLEICQDLLGRLVIEPNYLDKVITGDESWVFDKIPRPNGKMRNGTRKKFSSEEITYEQIQGENYDYCFFF